VVSLLLNIEKNASRTERTLKLTGNFNTFITILLHTVRFISLFVGLDTSNEAYVAALKQYEQAKQSTPTFRYKAIDECLNFLARRRIREDIPKKLLVDCSALESERDGKRSDTGDPVVSYHADIPDVDMAVEATMIDFPFAFTALTRMMKTNSSSIIFEEVLTLLDAAVSIYLCAISLS
jgi:hypothetical protein